MSQFIEMFGDPVSWQTDTSLPTLNDTVNVISGFPFDSEKFDTEGVGIPLIRIRDIQRGYSETFTTEVFDKQYRIKKYELLVGMDGMFDIARWQSDEAALNQRVCCLRMKGSENDTFIQYLVQPILKHIENGTNATTVKHISTKQINGIRVPIASHEQKNKFAMIANQADKSGFDELKSQFIEMFGDNVSKKKISDVCDVRGGSTPTRTTKEFWNNGTISWFTIEDIYEQGRYISETKQHITELATKKCFVYPVDTVLICCTASVGEYAITKKEMASNQQFNGMMIKDKSELHPEYLLYVASTLKEDLLRQAGKTTINFVSRSKLENIEIPVPPYSEQLGFVSVYRQADKSGSVLQYRIAC